MRESLAVLRAHEQISGIGREAERQIAEPEECFVHEEWPASPGRQRNSTCFAGDAPRTTSPAILCERHRRRCLCERCVTARRSRCQLAEPSLDTLMPRRTPIPRAFFLVSAANFLSFLNLAFFFLMPLWVHSKGGGAELAGRVSAINGFAG